MSDDGNKQHKNLWKNLKTEKNKYVKEEESSHGNKDNKRAQSLDQALEEARMTPEKILNKDPQTVSNVIKQINRDELMNRQQKEEDLDSIKININSEKKQEIQLDEQQRFFMPIKCEEEEFSFPEMPVVELDSQNEEQQPMMISNGTTNCNPIALFAAKNKLHSFIQQLRNQYETMKETIKNEERAYLVYLQQICETIITQLLQNSMVTPCFQMPAIVQDELLPQQQLLKQKEATIQTMQEEIDYLQQQIYQKEHLKKQLSVQLEVKLEDQSKIVEKLKKQIESLNKQVETLNQSNFDYEQKIAQIDLEVEKRLEAAIQKRMSEESKIKDRPHSKLATMKEEEQQLEDAGDNVAGESPPCYFQDRDYYINQMANMEKEIEKMSQNFLRQEEEYAFVKEQLYAREEEIRIKEEEMESTFKEFELKRLELESKMENIRKKDYELQIIEQQLKKRQAELDEKNRELIHREIELQQSVSMKRSRLDVNRSGDQDYLTGKSNDFMDNKFYGIRSDHPENPLPHNYQMKNYPKRSSPRYESGHNRVSSISGQKSRKYQTSNSLSRNYKTNFKASTATPHLISGSGISKKAYNKSKSNADSTRLHDLGNKLERLREEIRKEIRDAV